MTCSIITLRLPADRHQGSVWLCTRGTEALSLQHMLKSNMLNCGHLSHLYAQGAFFTGFLMRTMPYFRDRIIADQLFLFKVGAEVLIDSGMYAGEIDHALISNAHTCCCDWSPEHALHVFPALPLRDLIHLMCAHHLARSLRLPQIYRENAE